MKKISFLLLPLVAVSFLFSCSGNNYNDNCPYLTFNALEDSGATYRIIDEDDDVKVDVDIQYSTDKKTWTPWEKEKIIEIKKNKKIYIRNTKEHLSVNGVNYVQFVLSGKIAASGEISSLTSSNKIHEYEYCRLFENCASLVRTPFLPSTELATSCYSYMFANCFNLQEATKLPATQLAEYCYSDMFKSCFNLKKAPELPATQLAEYCYSNMFNYCLNLQEAPDLPATQLATSCYEYMFSDCQNLQKAPDLPATELAIDCYSNMFRSCFNLKKAPDLPATELAIDCYNNMFYYCTSLKKAPELPATELVDFCYYSMFSGCVNLQEAPELPATQLADYCYGCMFENCFILQKLKVGFGPDWPDESTSNWLYGAGTYALNPTFIWKGDKDPKFERDNHHVPSNWNIEHAN